MTDEAQTRQDEDPQRWFAEHFDAGGQVLAFFSDDGSALQGKVVGDVGSGDGIIDLALTLKGRPEKLVGYDIRPTDVDALLRAAKVAGVAQELPDTLSFDTSETGRLPAPDDYFDVLVSWSVFEHVSEPVAMMREIARVLKPGGILFLQLWPFYYSEHGGHLWPHYAEGFPHLLFDPAEIETHVRGRRGTDPTRGDAVDEWRSLNRLTLDELQRAMLASGLTTVKLELVGGAVQIPASLAHLRLGEVGISGVKLLAVTAAVPFADERS